MVRRIAALLVLTVCVAAVHPLDRAAAQDATGAAAQTDFESIITRLGADTAAERDTAQQELIALGESARASLVDAATSETLEIRRRARALLLRLDALEDARTGRDLTWAGLRGGPERSGVSGGALPATRPELLWSVPVHTRMLAEGSVIPSAERVVCLDSAGVVRSYDSVTGAQQWLHTLSGEAHITASAVLAANRLVVPTSKGVVTLDAATGQQLWSVPSSYGSYAAPAVSGRRVYASLRNVGLQAFDLSTGKSLFERKMAPKGALLVKNELVVIGTLDGELIRIDPVTGKNVWTRDLGGSPQMGPTLVGEHTIVVFVANRELRGIDARDGTVTWTRVLPARSESECLASAAGRVCVTGDDGYVRVIDGATGEFLWRRDSGMLQLGGPCMTDKHVVYSAGGMITCRDADSGDHVWRILGPARQTSTPSSWNGRVYVLFEEELLVYGVRDAK